jgi:hypothetical protein
MIRRRRIMGNEKEHRRGNESEGARFGRARDRGYLSAGRGRYERGEAIRNNFKHTRCGLER